MPSDLKQVMPPTDTAAGLLEHISRHLCYLARGGCPGFDCSKKTLAVIDAWTGSPDRQRETLADIRTDLGECRRCRLNRNRRRIVFGEGHPGARLVFVGEAPGREEDRQGRVFVGEAGQLLTRIIQAMTLTRDDVYICNIIKCRPPGNRNPQPDEIEACSPFLRRQLKAIDPEFVCALGSFAAQTLLGTTTPISRLRGRFFDYRGMRLLPTYHPAFLLRNPERKRDVWQDIQLLMAEMGLAAQKTC